MGVLEAFESSSALIGGGGDGLLTELSCSGLFNSFGCMDMF